MHKKLQKLFNKDKQILNIAFYGDSIFASGFRDIPNLTREQKQTLPFRGCEYLSIQRYLYNALNFNKPKFFNIKHPMFKFKHPVEYTGSKVMPNSVLNSAEINKPAYFAKYAYFGKNKDNSVKFTVNKCKDVVLVFESHAKNTDSTGKVKVNVTDKGKLKKIYRCKETKYKLSKEKGKFDTFFDTSFESPVPLNKYNVYAPIKWMHITGLDETKEYTFTVKHNKNDKPVVFWGIFTFSGKTLFVHNESKPGFSWNGLYDVAYADLIINNTDLVILEAPMYHDKNLEDAKTDAVRLIKYLQNAGMDVVLCSCTPGGVTPVGRIVKIGGEKFYAYLPGENLYVTFNKTRHFHTRDMKTDDSIPKKGDIYEAVINNKRYEFKCNRHIYKDNLSLTTYILPLELNEDINFPLTLKRKKGKGKKTIVYDSMEKRFTMEEHRDLMKSVAKQTGCVFIDLLKAFKKEAKTKGETLSTKGYPVPKDNILYKYCLSTKKHPENYPVNTGRFLMNHMTKFFNPGDGHHLEYPAHEIIYKTIAKKLDILI